MTKKKVTQQDAAPSLMGDAPDLQAMIEEAVNRQLASVQGAVAGAVDHLAQQMDERINTAFDSRIAGVRQEVTEFLGKLKQAQPQAAPESQAVTPAPSGNGGGSLGLKLLEQLGPLIPVFMQNIAQPPNPIAQITGQLQQVAELASALDTIRGGHTSNAKQTITPKTALDWAKWGHSLARDNKPVPTFDTVEFTTPPASNV